MMTADTPNERPPRKGSTVFPDPFDDWAGWKPEWRGGPHGLQESHSPTETVRHRTGLSAQDSACQRRIVDARLWEAMAPAQQDAALSIELACVTMGRGLGFATSKWDRIPGARGQGNVGEAHARLIAFYVEWAQACQKRKISHAMIVDILVQGLSCAEADRQRRVRKGTARGNLFDGLTLFCEMKGWRV